MSLPFPISLLQRPISPKYYWPTDHSNYHHNTSTSGRKLHEQRRSSLSACALLRGRKLQFLRRESRVYMADTLRHCSRICIYTPIPVLSGFPPFPPRRYVTDYVIPRANMHAAFPLARHHGNTHPDRVKGFYKSSLVTLLLTRTSAPYGQFDTHVPAGAINHQPSTINHQPALV